MNVIETCVLNYNVTHTWTEVSTLLIFYTLACESISWMLYKWSLILKLDLFYKYHMVCLFGPHWMFKK